MTTNQKPIEIAGQIELLESNLARLIDWVGKHDTKASVVLGIDTAMLGVLGSLAGAHPQLSTAGLASLVVAILPLAISLGCIYLGNFPKTTANRPSLLFFSSIAELETDSFKKKILHLTHEEYAGDLLSQCHTVAQILTKKFQYLRWAYRMLFLSMPLWALSVYLLVGITHAVAK